MIDDFEWQVRLSEGIITHSTTSQEEYSTEESTTPPDSKVKELEDEAKIIASTYGELIPGKNIEIPLGVACNLLHRERHRVDAFTHLAKYLHDNYQVTLKIISRKTKDYANRKNTQR